MVWTKQYYLVMLERDEEVLHVLGFQGIQRIMDRHRSHDTRRFSRAEGSRRWSDDVIRRQASLSIRCGAESSGRSIERTRLNEMEEACAQAIDRGWQKYQQEAKFYMLAQHPKAFLGKDVTSITVTKNFVGQIDIEYKFG